VRIDTCGSLPKHFDAESGSREVHAKNLGAKGITTPNRRLFRGCDFFTVQTRCLASQTGMVCAEYRRLEQRYNAALRRWAQYVRPQVTVPPGKDDLERARVLMQKALIERDSASAVLYQHRSTCLFSKTHEPKPD
jgi:hypothetical protein